MPFPRANRASRTAWRWCKLHHAAFDEHIVGVRPDYIVERSASMCFEEADGR
jgi:hypothetical protein